MRIERYGPPARPSTPPKRLLQLDDCCAGAALFGSSDVELFYVRVGLQKIRDSPFQDSHAVAVDDSDAVDLRERGGIEELVDLVAGFFRSLADQVDLPEIARKAGALVKIDVRGTSRSVGGR